MHDYTPQAKRYWRVTAVLGALLLALSLVQVASMGQSTLLQVALGVLLAALAGLFPVRLPGRKTSLAGAEILIFLLLLLYGPAAATLGAAAEAAVGSWRTSRRWTSRLGSPAMVGLAMYACGSAFAYAQSQLLLPGADAMGSKLGLLLVLGLVYFACGTLLLTALIKLKRGLPVRALQILREHAWLGLAYAGSGPIAGILHIAFGRFEFPVLFGAVPLIAAFLTGLHVYYRHAVAAGKMPAES
jgi:hypothetical protein